jgi:anti-sigma-K factor RskA
MTGNDRPPSSSAYRTARQASAILLVAVVAFAVLLDAVRGNSPQPLIVVPLLVAAAGLLAVDLPNLRG